LPLALALVVALFGAQGAAAAETAGEAVLREGLEALQSRQPERAAELLESAARLTPDDPRIWLGLAAARRSSGDDSGAEAAITRLLESFDPSPFLAHGIAMYYFDGGDVARAADFEAQYAALQPDDSEAFLRTASWYLQSNRADLAVEFARSGLERTPSAELYDVLGKGLADQGKIDEAEQAFRAAIELQPYDEELRYNLGYLFLQATRFDEAVAAFEEGRKVFDKSPRLELGIGVARFAQRRFDEAIDAFLLTSKLAPGLEQPHYFLSRSLEHAAGRVDDVRARFDAFAAARPDHYLAPFLQAKGLLASLGPARDAAKLSAAETLLRASIERRGDYWESHFELGVTLERMRRYEEAKAALLRATEISPASATPHYRLARVYVRLGQPELAEKENQLHQELVDAQRSAFTGGGMDAGAGIDQPILNSEPEPGP